MARIHQGQQLYNFPSTFESHVPIIASSSSRNNRSNLTKSWSTYSNNEIPELSQIANEAPPSRYLIPSFSTFDQTLQNNDNQWIDSINDYKNSKDINLLEREKYNNNLYIPREYFCKWKNCSSSFPDQYSLQMHVMRHVNNNFINYQSVCFVCGQCLKTHSELQEHISIEHFEDLPEILNSYNGPIPKKIQVVEDNNAPFKLTSSFNNMDTYTTTNESDGMILERSLREYEDFLGSFIVTPDSNVKVTDSRRRYKCSFPGCGKSFKRSGHLKRHNSVHLPQKERRRYFCEHDGCKKNYSTKYDLAAHIRQIHEGVILYKCIYKGCCRRFVKKNSLEHHLKTFDHRNTVVSKSSFMSDSNEEYLDMMVQM